MTLRHCSHIRCLQTPVEEGTGLGVEVPRVWKCPVDGSPCRPAGPLLIHAASLSWPRWPGPRDGQRLTPEQRGLSRTSALRSMLGGHPQTETLLHHQTCKAALG